MTFPMDYVLGFAFTPLGDVALIQKKRPHWQKNLINGIGGKRQQFEPPARAMAREFKEETDVEIPVNAWVQAGVMRCDDLWRVHVFTVIHESVRKIKTVTDEPVRLYSAPELELPVIREMLIENLPSLIELCKMKPNHEATIPMFNLDYSHGR